MTCLLLIIIIILAFPACYLSRCHALVPSHNNFAFSACVMDAWLRERGSVELRAFGHLVSGHSLLLELSEDTICKPLLFAQERAFYESMPAAIQQFAPKYHGKAGLYALDVIFEYILS